MLIGVVEVDMLVGIVCAPGPMIFNAASVLRLMAAFALRVLLLLRFPDRARARRRTAGAGKRPDILVEIVVYSQLLAPADGAQAYIEDVAFQDAAHQIGIAAMIDDLGAAAAHRTIQRPIGIHGEQVGIIAVAPDLRLFAIQPLAGIFDHLTIGWYTLAGEDSVPVDLRTPDLKLKTSELLV